MTKFLRNACLVGTALTAISTNGFAQNTGLPKTHRHRDAAVTASDRLDLLEKRIEQQAQEIQDLKSQLNQGSSRVSSQEFQALQSQVFETQAAVKSQTANQASVLFKPSQPSFHQKARITISSPDGKYTFSPIATVQGDFASYSKGQPLGNGATVGKNDLKSSGTNFRRAQIGFQGTFAGDFGYRFFYDFGGANGDETYQGYAGPNSGVYIQTCKVPTSPCPAGSQTTTLLNNAFNTSTGAGTGPHVKEAWLSYKGILDPFTFKIGALPTPANLNDVTAAEDLLLNERPSPSQLSRGLDADDGRDSVGFVGNGSNWNASLFLTGDTFGKAALLAPQTTYGGSQEAVVGRVVFLPWHDADTNFNIHLGLNGGYVIHPQETTTVTASGVSGVTSYGITFSDRPELRVDNVTFLNTGAIDAKSAYSTGIELAASYGPLLIEGEDFRYGIERNKNGLPAGVSNPSFSGWYVEGSWILTGEPRPYNVAAGSFARPSPAAPFDPANDDWGAWEVAARYSSANLDHDVTSTVSADRIFGGIQRITSAGLNFYPNDVLKFMLDWQYVDLKDIGALNNNGNYNTIIVRTQVSF